MYYTHAIITHDLYFINDVPGKNSVQIPCRIIFRGNFSEIFIDSSQITLWSDMWSEINKNLGLSYLKEVSIQEKVITAWVLYSILKLTQSFTSRVLNNRLCNVLLQRSKRLRMGTTFRKSFSDYNFYWWLQTHPNNQNIW